MPASRTPVAFALFVLLAATTCGPTMVTKAAAQPAKVLSPVAQWKVDGKLGKSSGARQNLSGLACTATFKACIAVNDDKKYAQLFNIAGTTIQPGDIVRLPSGDGDPDSEGAAYDAKTSRFYVIGSHGRPRHHPEEKNDASYNVFRFAVDPATGVPNLSKKDGEFIVTEATPALRTVLETANKIDDKGATVADKFDKPLDDGGVNIEGIAIAYERIYMGLRGPSKDNQAFVLSVNVEAAFSGAQLDARIAALKLGKDTGIRDLASVRDGLLILSGPVNDQPVTPAIFLWNPANDHLKELGTLKLPADLVTAKAEGLLVLEDKDAQDYRVLVMFDGPDNGAPTEYVVSR